MMVKGDVKSVVLRERQRGMTCREKDGESDRVSELE